MFPTFQKFSQRKRGGRGKTCKIKWAWWYTSDISATLILNSKIIHIL